MRKKPEVSLRARALQYLARREYSRAELFSKLERYAQADEDSESVTDPIHQTDVDTLLDDLTVRGWLSDERAATQLVHAKSGRFGLQRIVHELRQKGIAEYLIADATSKLKENELESARDVWRRKFGVRARDAKEKAKQMRFLQSRGFSIDVIINVLCGVESPE